MERMPSLTNFNMIEPKMDIPDITEYIETLLRNLIIENHLPLAINDGVTEAEEYGQVEAVFAKLIYSNGTSAKLFCIEFEVGTYTASKQLAVSLLSKDYTVSTNSTDTFLEKFRTLLYKRLLEDWKTCVWVSDKESEAFSLLLYPEIHKTENLFRAFINEVMTKKFGANWWDNLAPVKLKTKHKDRHESYTSIVPAFKNVDEKLMTIDVRDLLKITNLKIKKWTPTHCNTIESLLSTNDKLYSSEIFKELIKQITTEKDLWKDYFSKYLDDKFHSKFALFETYRNHIAHNKLIDKSAYGLIRKSVEDVYTELNNGLQAFRTANLSVEHETINMYEQEELDDAMLCIKEQEAGVKINSNHEIFDIYLEEINIMYTNLVEHFSFRPDVLFSYLADIDYSERKTILFEVTSNITTEKIIISADFFIDDSEGMDSTLTLFAVYKEFSESFKVSYTNGEIIFNDHQGCYMPEAKDEFSSYDMDKAFEGLISFIDENFENQIMAIEQQLRTIIKEGGLAPWADEPCCECGEEYICINETFGEYGQCLKCGERHEDICLCEECNRYNYGNRIEGELFICDNCWENKVKE